MTSYEKICKILTQRKFCGCKYCVDENTYLCVKKTVKKFVDHDKNKLLTLKAEALKYTDANLNFAVLSMIISVCSLLCSILLDPQNIGCFPDNLFLAFICFVILFSVIILCFLNSKERYWQPYIMLAIKELERGY